MRFDSIKAVGFDMDYTLAEYSRGALEQTAFDFAVKTLFSMGYPQEVHELVYRPGTTIRGLVVDKELGNILKMDRYQFVSIAFHGDRELNQEERREHYANLSIPLGLGRFTSVDTLFAMPEVDLFEQLVTLKDENPDLFGPRSYTMLWNDLRHAVDLCHRDGRLKAAVLADLNRYFIEDPSLPEALAGLRAMGKKLFVLTNSEHFYTEAVMAHLLDGRLDEYPRWTDYFDQIVVHAGKPGYFLEYSQSTEVTKETGADGVERVIYLGGNYRQLHDRLGCEGDDVLFVGDHIYGDVIRSKTHSFWRTCMIVPELDSELEANQKLVQNIQEYRTVLSKMEQAESKRTALHWKASSNPSDTEAFKQAELADEETRDIYREVKRQEKLIDRTFHPRWGALFHDGGAVSRFGAQVARYADIYASKVSNLARYRADCWFHTPWEVLPHRRLNTMEETA